jgi:FkbM family methyltransferase
MKEWLRQFWLKNLLRVFPYRFQSPGGLRVDCRRRYEIKMCEAFFVRRHYPMEYVRRPVRTVFDIGANIGLFSLACVEQFGDEVRQIVAVEPSRKTFGRLQENIAKNRLQTRVSPVNEAVAGAPGKATFRIGHAHYSHSLEAAKIQNPRATELVSVTTLDELKRRYAVESVDLLKIDVEGSELAVLEGAGEFLKIARTLFIEVHRGFCQRADVERALAPFGLVLAPWEDSLERDHGDFCFVRA